MREIRRFGVVGKVSAFQSGGRSIPSGVRILIPILAPGVCPFSVYCLVLSLAEALTFCCADIQ